MKWSNSIKREARIIKRGSSYNNNLSAVTNLISDTNTTEESTDSILKYIIPLSSDTPKYAFYHMGEEINNLPDLKKRTDALEVARKWGKDIIKEGVRKIA